MRKLIAALTVAGLGLTTFGALAPSTGAAPPPGTGVTARAADRGRRRAPQPARGQAAGAQGDGPRRGHRRQRPAPAGQRQHRRQGRRDERARAVGATAVARDQYVELENEGTDRVFTLLVEFGNQRHPEYPDQDTDPDTPGPARFDGPLHNQIPEPDRAVDNSTQWQPDYSRSYFQNLYFGTGRGVESLRTYYEKQSSGRYSVTGDATAWVTVPYNEARYGRSNGFPCDDVVCDNTWNLVEDGMNHWVAARAAAGLTPEQIKAELATFDIYDRYDFDGDGNFNEPDGYIDHLQIVHAGGDQADGDPYQGEDAIWSHRWYAFVTDAGVTGPADEPARRQAGRRHRHLGRRLHHPGRERWPVHHRPRVRARPRPAGPLRHRRRRQQRRVVEPDGAEPPVRQGRAPRHPAPATCRHGTSSSSAGSTTRSPWPARPGRSSSDRTSTTRPRPRPRPRPAREDRDVRVRRARSPANGSGGRAAATTSATR